MAMAIARARGEQLRELGIHARKTKIVGRSFWPPIKNSRRRKSPPYNSW
jgi:hypothetical protein